MISYLKSI